jgi:hypothetical protein
MTRQPTEPEPFRLRLRPLPVRFWRSFRSYRAIGMPTWSAARAAWFVSTGGLRR